MIPDLLSATFFIRARGVVTSAGGVDLSGLSRLVVSLSNPYMTSYYPHVTNQDAYIQMPH